MKRFISVFLILLGIFSFAGCGPSYKVKPMPFKAPSAFENVVSIEGAQIASRAYTDRAETAQAFGFDILAAGMLPVQVIFDNQGSHTLEINGHQS